MDKEIRKMLQETEERFICLMKEMKEHEVTNKTIQSMNEAKRLTIFDIKYLVENNGISNALLGKTIFIPNKGKCYLFKVIGANHEDTSNTIDLQAIFNAIPFQVFDEKTNIYKDSSIRKYLNGEYYECFGELTKELIIPMKVKSNGKILEDKVKLISMTEMGLEKYRNDNKIAPSEGEEYPIHVHYLSDPSTHNNYNINTNYINHMTRSCELGDNNAIWRICFEGDIGYNFITHERGAAPIIRLGKQQ